MTYAVSGWQTRPDLINKKFKPVFGTHTGGGSNSDLIATQLGQRIQVAPIYWKNAGSPKEACVSFLDRGTLPRLELCFPHIFTSTGKRMPISGGSFWARSGAGEYNDLWIPLLQAVGELDTPILLSTGHESDLRSEDGASPKNENPPEKDFCGDWSEFRGHWENFAFLARTLAPKARLFMNFSGGYSDAPKRWSQMLPSKGTFDFFGWDFYSQYGKTSSTWDSFETRLKMFGRWDWYKKNLPDVPLIIGETGVCAGPEPGGYKDAGRWLIDALGFTLANRWWGVGTGGGISQVHYFSHHYADHPRCLDDNNNHPGCDEGQKWRVLPEIGDNKGFAWAGSKDDN